MAFVALESIREAELNAQKQIDDVQKQSDDAIKEARVKADKIIEAAYEDARVHTETVSDKTKTQADEIIVTAKNSAILESSKLKKSCEDKQDAVNDKVFSLIK